MPTAIPGPPPLATTTLNGLVSTAAQSFAGAKTFTSTIEATRMISGAGSATAVAFGPTGDPNTGLWFPASDTINMVTGGTLRCQIDSSGVVWVEKQLKLDSAARVINVPQVVLPGGAGGFGYGGGLEIGGTFNGLYHNGTSLYLQSYNSTANLQSFTGTGQVMGFFGASMGASDVAVKLGTSQAPASINNSHKLVSIRDTIGGAEIEYAYFRGVKTGGGSAFLSLATLDTKSVTHAGALNIINNGAGDSGIWFEGAASSGGVDIGLGSVSTRGLYTKSTNRTQSWYINGDAFSTTARAIFDWQADETVNMNPKDFARYTSAATHTGNQAGWYLGSNQVAAIDKDGNFQSNMNGAARPTANASNRGKLWYSKSAGGVADTVEICLKSAADTYSWVVIATG